MNNAGVYPSGFLLDIDAAEWDRIMDINVRVPFLLTQMVAKQMIGASAAAAWSTSRPVPHARCGAASCRIACRRPRSTG